MIFIIAAVAKNRAFGLGNSLLYWLPNDLKRFKQLTSGHTIVMGRRTFESLPKGALPNRRNCVLTRSQKELPGCECFASWDDFAASCQPGEEVFVIGGASIYKALIGKADRLCLTEVDDTPQEADAFFPDYSSGWREVWREDHQPDERHAHAYAFVDYEPSPATDRHSEDDETALRGQGSGG